MRCSICSLVMAVAVVGCKAPLQQNLPPAERLMHPGPGVDGPGPGVMMYQPNVPATPQNSQVAFIGPEGMDVTWDVSMAGAFDSEPLVCPGRYNFPQGAIYRLKLTDVPGRPGHRALSDARSWHGHPADLRLLGPQRHPGPIHRRGFRPGPKRQFCHQGDLPARSRVPATRPLAGVETLVSTRLEPGQDPIVEADRRGAILAIVRLGNKDLQMPGGMVEMDGVMQTSYGMAQPTGTGAPLGAPCPVGPPTMPGVYVSGMTGPQYGMPMSGTPIGLPGPPHVPFRHSRRTREARHPQPPHRRPPARPDEECQNRRPPGARHQLSQACQPRPNSRARGVGPRRLHPTPRTTASTVSIPAAAATSSARRKRPVRNACK